jgi:uncharacterized protein YuzB (UPF0349 family)
MSKKISFCICNEGYEILLEKVKNNFKDHIVTENKCIGVCNLCGYKFIARVDGKLIEGETTEEAYELIAKEILD